MGWFRRESKLERELREMRPAPRDEFVSGLAASMRPAEARGAKGAWARPVTAAVLTVGLSARSSGLAPSRALAVSPPRRGMPSSKQSAWRLHPPGR